ncbi:MAG: isopentenyl-diphosphate Delta-isomerase [Bacteroidota bacterium]
MSDIKEECVVLVDENDRAIGTHEKLDVHRLGLLHRAVSILVFNSRSEMLLQRRSDDKYHSGGLWSNACCTHPRPGEQTATAAVRRLKEEMGIQCVLTRRSKLVYRAAVSPELVEHEFDHVFTGTYGGVPEPDPAEVCDWRWVSAAQLDREMQRSPEQFTVWFKILYHQGLGRAGSVMTRIAS